MKPSHLAVAGVALMSLLLGACSSDGDKAADSDKTTTTVEADSDTTDSTTPPTTVDDDQYAAAAATFTDAIAAAGDDVCALMAATTQAPLPDPANDEQTKLGLDARIDVLRALATTLPEAQAATLNASADSFDEFFKKYDYNLDKIDGASEEFAALQNDPAYVEAMTAIQTEAATCTPDAAATDPTAGE